MPLTRQISLKKRGRPDGSCFCANRLSHRPAETRVLVKTKTPQIIRHRFGSRSEQQLHRWFAVVRAYLDDLDRGEFLH